MEIDKELLLLNKLIYDSRIKQCGIISSLEITSLCSTTAKYSYWYTVYYDIRHNHDMLFSQDIDNGYIKFLIPYGPTIIKDYEPIIIKDLKEYFGDKFSDNLILRMPEEERQRQINEMKDFFNSLDFWNKYLEHSDISLT